MAGIASVLTPGCGAERPGPAPPHAVVIRVTDGDTIVVRSGSHTESVRLIGIDTPEIAHHGQPADCYGPEAAARTTEILPVGSVVRLLRDAEARDVYDRLLAYVELPDGRTVNQILATEGMARPLAISPNLAMADAIHAATDEARARGAGLWARCDEP